MYVTAIRSEDYIWHKNLPVNKNYLFFSFLSLFCWHLWNIKLSQKSPIISKSYRSSFTAPPHALYHHFVIYNHLERQEMLTLGICQWSYCLNLRFCVAFSCASFFRPVIMLNYVRVDNIINTIHITVYALYRSIINKYIFEQKEGSFYGHTRTFSL